MITCARSASRAQRLADRVRGLAADARVDLVEDHRLAAADGRDRERDRAKLAARGRLGDRRERQPAFGRIRNDDLVGAGRARLALAQLGPELALAEADAVQLGCDRVRERRRPQPPARFDSSLGERLDSRLGLGQRRARPPQRDRRRPRAQPARLAPRPRARAAPRSVSQRKRRLRVGDPLELGLDLLEPVGLGLERVEEPPQLERRLAQAKLGVAQLVAPRRRAPGASRSTGASDALGCCGESRRARHPRRARALPPRGRAASASSVTCRSRSRSARSDVLASPGSSPPCPRRARAARRAAPPRPPRRALSSSCRRRAAPSSRQASAQLRAQPQLLLADERVEDVELVRRPREPALLELARHRDQPLGRGGHDPRARRSGPSA